MESIREEIQQKVQLPGVLMYGSCDKTRIGYASHGLKPVAKIGEADLKSELIGRNETLLTISGMLCVR